MKLTFLLVLSLILQANATGYAQQVTLHVKAASLLDVMKSIRKQTGYLFVFDLEMLSNARPVDCAQDEVPLEHALEVVFKDQPLTYSIVNKTIIIKRKPAIPTSVPQNLRIKIKGQVTEARGTPMVGVSVVNKSSHTNSLTDEMGIFTIEANVGDSLSFSMIGMIPVTVQIKNEKLLKIVMQQKVSDVGEVVVVAYGTQKKASMVSAVTSINPKELKGPTSNLTTMLAGRLAGVISYQRSGEPGKDNASFFIRGLTTFGTGKVDPLILIDGMESSTTDLARLQPDDIAGFSILKDATASSLYGARGANGVVLVNTKSGVEAKTTLNVRFENSISSNTRNFQFADNITYMKLANEAVLTRDPLGIVQYPQSKIDHTAAGDDPLLYPNNNWIKQLIKDYTVNQRTNFSLKGGGKVAQFYIAGTYNVDNGVLNVDKRNNFNSNIKLKNYSLRSNVNINLTPTTQAVVRTYGQFDGYNGPVGGGAGLFAQTVWANPVMFPASYPGSYAPEYKHPLFGNAVKPGFSGVPGDASNLYNNPYANSVSGYQQYNTSTLLVQLEMKQGFKFLLPGLTGRMMAYTERYSYFDITRQYSPFFYGMSYDAYTKNPTLQPLNTNGTEYLNYSPGNRVLNTTSYMEAAVNYSQQFNKVHNVSGMLIGLFRNYLSGNANDLQTSLPHRNQGISGRFTYDYDTRYLAEVNFGYNGSERFASNHRFGFFPSAGVAWNIQNEKFFKPLEKTIDKLKLRATYGLVGNDQIGNENDRFFYLSDVNMNAGWKGASFGEKNSYGRPGVNVNRYENRDITWEKSYKTNLGLELGLFNALNIQVDVYKEHRTNILMVRSTIPSTMGLSAPIQANVGEAAGKGVDLSMDYTKSFSNNTFIQLRGTFTYATSKLLVNEEPQYPEAYRSHVGYSLSQNFGYIAERLFVDDQEVANSAYQNWGQAVMGGDIKYRDVNHDGKITEADMVPIGLPTTPEITYGFGFSFGYKQFDLSCFFQGSARSSFWINSYIISPFVLNGGGQHGLLNAVANDHWSESDRNLYAFWPRLSNYFVNNNNQNSTWWMRSGNFLRLKTVELGYSFPKSLLDKVHMTNTRIYANALNLFAISKFKTWDPEMGGDGLGYPVQRVVNIGINVGL
ncbi:TonB-linked SusC/RagA family outer membrane protein [Chitinophaga niastensis]|uniref:TonB-linked SusC/RagA family outer membrane protein n=1 Tax=Chitinophaga niastensis TaxID=536980 RepID=A0A2P8HQA2_CHINA|nr:TonB-dependent receptor [Chitinophaga niastensis]PSL48385.1 TonB-linked SusC/RagA family outer membrane protein [Chitinophaga niastensis]